MRTITASEERILESNSKLEADPEKEIVRPDISRLGLSISRLITCISRLYSIIS